MYRKLEDDAIEFLPVLCWHTYKEKDKMPIGKQAEKAAEQIINALKGYPGEGKDISIVLMGYSQGGLRAFTAIKTLKEAGHNVKCLVTLATPWKGSGVLDLQGFFHKQQLVISGIDRDGQGVRDMVPGSTFLEGVHESLKKNETPTMVIGGTCKVPKRRKISCTEQLKKILQFRGYVRITKKHACRYAARRVFRELEVDKHDSAVPLNSQLAEDIDKIHFECETLENCHHGTLIGNEVLGVNTSILEHPGAHEKAAKFILEQLLKK